MTTPEHELSPAYQDADLAALDIIKTAATDPDYLLTKAMEEMDRLQRAYNDTTGAHFLIAALGKRAGAWAAAQFTTHDDEGVHTVDTEAMEKFLDEKYMVALRQQARYGEDTVGRWLVQLHNPNAEEW